MISYILLIVIISCKSQNTKYKSLNLIVNYPLVISEKDNKTVLYHLNDTITITEFNNYRIYKLKPRRELNTNKKIQFSSSYFCYNKDSVSGYFFFDNNSLNNPKLLNVDSLLSLEAFSKINVNLTSDYKVDQIIKSSVETIEKYYFDNTNEEMMDSAYLYFKKNINLFYSFSPQLDTLRNKKLYKFRILFNSKYSKKYQQNLPKREFNFEIQSFDMIPIDSFIIKVSEKYCKSS